MNDIDDAVDVLNEKPRRAATWTTVNAGEAAFPGVPTPLSWTWSWWPTEYGIRGAFASIGSFGPTFAEPPAELADRVLTIHQGHVAINLDLFRAVADAIPNSSGDEVERAYFGSTREGVRGRSRRWRYPVVAVRMPVSAVRSRRAMLRFEAPTDQWWREVVARTDLDSQEARNLLRESQHRYATIARPHTVVGMVTQGLYDQVRKLCSDAGTPDTAGILVPGGQDEIRWLSALWEVARGNGNLDDFLRNYGYHGPLEGELSYPTWRVDPGPLKNLLTVYAKDADRESPAMLTARRGQECREAQTDLLASLPRTRRVPARALLAAARAYMPLRESGRATFLRAYDAARHAARTLGLHLAAQGAIDNADDVFFLTFDELTASQPPVRARELVAARRELREHYRTIELPNLWTGQPTPTVVLDDEHPARGDEPLLGQGVSAGVAEGTVRVVVDPADGDDLEPGDILVCRVTDPSWATLFFVAGAVVTDLGGDMSHGAIVARELGLPAVVNTRDGTRRLKNGERVRVDGTSGTVTRL